MRPLPNVSALWAFEIDAQELPTSKYDPNTKQLTRVIKCLRV
jgi:hypothetical protein